jgi:outer membrane protein
MKKTLIAALILGSLSGGAYAHEAGEFFFRAGSATVRPTEGSDNVLGMGGFNVSNNTQLGMTFTWMATDNVGVELLAATPFRHKVGLGPTGDIATVHHLPPTLMAQWYFGDASSKVRPYIGAGVNYTTFFDEKFNDKGKAAGLSDLSLLPKQIERNALKKGELTVDDSAIRPRRDGDLRYCLCAGS